MKKIIEKNISAMEKARDTLFDTPPGSQERLKKMNNMELFLSEAKTHYLNLKLTNAWFILVIARNSKDEYTYLNKKNLIQDYKDTTWLTRVPKIIQTELQEIEETMFELWYAPDEHYNF